MAFGKQTSVIIKNVHFYLETQHMHLIYDLNKSNMIIVVEDNSKKQNRGEKPLHAIKCISI